MFRLGAFYVCLLVKFTRFAAPRRINVIFFTLFMFLHTQLRSCIDILYRCYIFRSPIYCEIYNGLLYMVPKEDLAFIRTVVEYYQAD